MMDQIVVAMLVEVCSKEAGQLRLESDQQIFSDEVTEGRSSVRANRLDREQLTEIGGLRGLKCGLKCVIGE